MNLSRVVKLDKPINLLLLIVITLGYCIYLWYWNVESDGVWETGDGIMHYQIAHHSWEKPILLLDHWGKPLFTLLSSPFAQFGYIGMTCFNLLLFTISCFLLWRIAQHFKLSFSWVLPLLLMSAPVYYRMVNCGMTEVLFSTLLVAIIWCFVKEKYAWGSIIASFLIFSRPEGAIVMPFIGLYLILIKQWKILPYLTTGYFIYSTIGYFALDNFWWVMSEDPYPNETSLYGSGPLTYFVDQYKDIFGNLLVVAGSLGVVFTLYSSLKSKKYNEFFFWTLIVIGPLVAVFSVHSMLWWMGWKGSLGLIRVITTVVPLLVLLALVGLNVVHQYLKQKYEAKSLLAFHVLFIGFSLHVINFSSRALPFPIKQDRIQELTTEAAQWYLDQEHEGKVSYLDPYFAFKADINPFDEDGCILLWSLDREQPSRWLKPGDMVVWDGHFGPNEGGLPLELMMNDPRLKMVKHFEPDSFIEVLGGHKYEIYFFEVI